MYDSTKHVRVRRSAITADQAMATPGMGNMVRVEEPTAVTLTGSPANQRPFQVIRSDPAATAAKRVGRVRRTDSPVLAITFPANYTEAEVAATLQEYEMSSYVVSQDAAGIFSAIRNDLQSLANIQRTDIKLNADGVIASLDASHYKITRADSQDNIALVSFEFDAKRFDADTIFSWFVENNIDSAQDTVENPSGELLTVNRSAVEEGTDVRRVQLGDGVVGVLKRSDIFDVPAAFVESVCETAYGNWGWGHLEFNASMADREFCQVMEDACYKLEQVLRNITLNSQLPLESRKALVDRSLAQYGEFVKNVIDALPRQVMLLVTRAAEPKESMNMKTAEQAAAATPAVAAPVVDATPITRADLAAAVTAGVAAAMAAQRSEPAATAVVEPTAAATTVAAPAATTDVVRTDAVVITDGAITASNLVANGGVITGDMVSISRADMTAMINAATAPLMEKLTAMESTVIVRSDSGDRTVKAAGVTQAKRSADQVFQGAIPGLPPIKK